ncbi:MAG: DNA methyltransferase [Candidatus Hodarchaeales archaeon]
MSLSISECLSQYLTSAQSSYQTIILNIPELFKQTADCISPALWKDLQGKLKPSGSMWLFVQDFYEVKSKKYVPRVFEILENLAETGFYIRNCIVRFKPGSTHNGIFSQFYDNILFCVLDLEAYQFEKDKIREKHIWKDAEWGGGRRSRYNPKGKDPSNFWIRTESTKGKITDYYPLDDLKAMSRILLASCNANDPALLVYDQLDDQNWSSLKSHAKLDFFRPNWEKHPIGVNNGNILLNARKLNQQRANVDKLSAIRVFYKSSESMREVPDQCVQTIVTSPPYWDLRDYDHPQQIGIHESYETYRERLSAVWRECYRVLSPSGTLWVNINKRIIKGHYLNIPYDYIKDITATDFTLLDVIIWHRPISVPGYGEKNLADRYETILLFAKNPDTCVLDKAAFQSEDYAPSYVGHLPNVWKLFRKIGNIGKTVRSMVRECQLKHTAMYPEELPRRAIRLGTKPGELVLDPFLGSGTTVAVAKELGRRAIAYEINPKYRPIIEFRLKSKPVLEAYLRPSKQKAN